MECRRKVGASIWRVVKSLSEGFSVFRILFECEERRNMDFSVFGVTETRMEKKNESQVIIVGPIYWLEYTGHCVLSSLYPSLHLIFMSVLKYEYDTPLSSFFSSFCFFFSVIPFRRRTSDHGIKALTQGHKDSHWHCQDLSWDMPDPWAGVFSSILVSFMKIPGRWKLSQEHVVMTFGFWVGLVRLNRQNLNGLKCSGGWWINYLEYCSSVKLSEMMEMLYVCPIQ